MAGIIDYAGLFPPAKLDMATAVANYLNYRNGGHSWILGKFVVPVSRLDEFQHDASSLLPHENSTPVLLSALCGSDARNDLDRCRDFNNGLFAAWHNIVIDTVEIKAASPEEIASIGGIIPEFLSGYFEISLNDALDEMVHALAGIKKCAKVRTGGVTPDAFPSATDVIRFITACSANNVPFKATAGLHHPICSTYAFTYEPGSPRGRMFGFLNLFLCSAFIRAGMNGEDAADILNESASHAFQFDEQGVEWRGFHIDGEQLKAAREGFALSFGSCSFTEPIDELQALNLL